MFLKCPIFRNKKINRDVINADLTWFFKIKLSTSQIEKAKKTLSNKGITNPINGKRSML